MTQTLQPAHPSFDAAEQWPSATGALDGWRSGLDPIDATLLLATGVMGLHVVDDNFVQPAAGTSALDHLASGLLPLAVLAALVLAAVSARRRRPGISAAIATLLGLAGLTLASEAVYYSTVVGPSGDDYTGLLTLPAGLAAFGVAGVGAWRSRRRDGPRLRRVGRGVAVGVASFLTFQYVVFPVAVAYVLTHVGVAEVPTPELGVVPQDVLFESSDGLTLHGWYVPPRNGAAVIVSPGRGGSQDEAHMLVRNGYGVLLFDERGEGDSEGEPHMLGWSGRKDLDGAVQFLHRQGIEAGRIGGLGLSVGGEMLIETAGQSDGIAALVSEGASERWGGDEFAYDAPGSKWFGLPAIALRDAAMAVFANRLPPPLLEDEAADIAPRPVLFIAGAEGQAAEVPANENFLAAAGERAELWIIPGAGHVGGLRTAPADYEQRVVGFFDAALLDGADR